LIVSSWVIFYLPFQSNNTVTVSLWMETNLLRWPIKGILMDQEMNIKVYVQKVKKRVKGIQASLE